MGLVVLQPTRARVTEATTARPHAHDFAISALPVLRLRDPATRILAPEDRGRLSRGGMIGRDSEGGNGTLVQRRLFTVSRQSTSAPFSRYRFRSAQHHGCAARGKIGE